MFVLFAAILALTLALVPGAGAVAPVPRASCDGERATIVTDAPLVLGTGGHDVIVAGPGDNEIHGVGGSDTICAGRGEDELFGERGNDRLLGGAGDDLLEGERGSDELRGGPGTDRLIGDTGNDRLLGGGGNDDRLEGGPGDDSLDGGGGEADVITGGPGIDSIAGGAGGHDIASYEGTGGPVTIDLPDQTVAGAEEERLAGIEDAIGGYGDDAITASSGSVNRLDGGPGEDRLLARGIGDEGFGGPGSDNCEGFSLSAARSCGPEEQGDGLMVERYRAIDGAAGLIVTGTSGADRATVAYEAGAFTVRGLPGGTPVILGDPGAADCRRRAGDSVSCAEVTAISASLRGGDDRLQLEATIPATVGATVDGGAGTDAIRGGPGDDTLYGGDDRDPDSLEGAPGDDVIFGINIFHPRRAAGGATMRGGSGDDLLIGGQPCDGDLFDGGGGENDSASFARVRNTGLFVQAQIGGAVLDPDVPDCTPGLIDDSVEKIEGSPGPDLLIGNGAANTLLGRGEDDEIDARGGFDRCIQGAGIGVLSGCEASSWAARARSRAR